MARCIKSGATAAALSLALISGCGNHDTKLHPRRPCWPTRLPFTVWNWAAGWSFVASRVTGVVPADGSVIDEWVLFRRDHSQGTGQRQESRSWIFAPGFAWFLLPAMLYLTLSTTKPFRPDRGDF